MLGVLLLTLKRTARNPETRFGSHTEAGFSLPKPKSNPIEIQTKINRPDFNKDFAAGLSKHGLLTEYTRINRGLLAGQPSAKRLEYKGISSPKPHLCSLMP
jgi:hypothetical protein